MQPQYSSYPQVATLLSDSMISPVWPVIPAERHGKMLSALHTNQSMRMLRLVCLFIFCIIFFCLLVPSPVRAQNTASATPPPTLDVSQATNTLYRNNYWTTIQVTVSTPSTPLSGLLVAQMCNFIGRNATQVGFVSPWRYQLPIYLNAGTKKQFAISLPRPMGSFDPQGVLVTLLDSHGKELTSTTFLSYLSFIRCRSLAA